MRRIALLMIPLLLASPALAETAAQFSVPGFRAPDESDVNGFRAALLYGDVDSMRGFDLGIFSLSKSGDMSGLGLIFGAAWITGQASGATLSMVNFNEGDATGVLAAIVNKTSSMNDGANLGMVNYTEGYSMVDVGMVSLSEQSKVQVGMLNISKEIETVQIGLLNFAENGVFPILPLVNFPSN